MREHYQGPGETNARKLEIPKLNENRSGWRGGPSGNMIPRPGFCPQNLCKKVVARACNPNTEEVREVDLLASKDPVSKKGGGVGGFG